MKPNFISYAMFSTLSLIGLLQATNTPPASEPMAQFRRTCIHYLTDDNTPWDKYDHLRSDFKINYEARDDQITIRGMINGNVSPSNWPLPACGQIVAEFREDDDEPFTVRGLGTLIGPYHVLTTAHMLYYHPTDISRFEHPWVNKITFTSSTNETATGLAVFVTNSWVKDRGYGFGLIILDKPLGSQLGWLGLRWQQDLDPSNLEWLTALNNSNTPLKKDSIYMNYLEQEYIPHKQGILEQECGGSLCARFGNDTQPEYYLMGINYYHRLPANACYSKESIVREGNVSHRISEQKIKRIIEWMNDYPISRYQRQELSTTKLLKEKSKQGDAQSYLAFAQRYEEGRGVKRDLNKAFRMYQDLSSFRHTELSNVYMAFVENKLGHYFMIGEIVIKNLEEALFYNKRAHRLDPTNLDYIFNMGQIYQERDSQEDRSKAFKYLKLAADQGHAQAIEKVEQLTTAVTTEYSKKNADAILGQFEESH